MANHTPLVEAWIRYAEDDWQDSQILASAGGNGRSICFHVQQCIEKLFKAELMRLKLPVPKRHNLRELSDLLHQADDRWIAETMTLNRLSLAAVDFRYPDPSEPEPEIDLAFILQIASELRSLLLDRLGTCR
ncbi:MAG: HEPN domain-containing protein [Cyanobacteria bacterium]|nr:HEPN domain-containing protein [Cyanobacteriota bacterium]